MRSGGVLIFELNQRSANSWSVRAANFCQSWSSSFTVSESLRYNGNRTDLRRSKRLDNDQRESAIKAVSFLSTLKVAELLGEFLNCVESSITTEKEGFAHEPADHPKNDEGEHAESFGDDLHFSLCTTHSLRLKPMKRKPRWETGQLSPRR